MNLRPEGTSDREHSTNKPITFYLGDQYLLNNGTVPGHHRLCHRANRNDRSAPRHLIQASVSCMKLINFALNCSALLSNFCALLLCLSKITMNSAINLKQIPFTRKKVLLATLNINDAKANCLHNVGIRQIQHLTLPEKPLFSFQRLNNSIDQHFKVFIFVRQVPLSRFHFYRDSAENKSNLHSVVIAPLPLPKVSRRTRIVLSFSDKLPLMLKNFTGLLLVSLVSFPVALNRPTNDPDREQSLNPSSPTAAAKPTTNTFPRITNHGFSPHNKGITIRQLAPASQWAGGAA